MIWNHIIIDIVDFTHKEISIYCLMSFQVLKKRNCVKVSLIFIPLNGHWLKTKEINNGRMHVANKINWIGIEDPETLNTINLHKSSVICAVITYYNKTTNIYCFTGKTLIRFRWFVFIEQLTDWMSLYSESFIIEREYLLKMVDWKFRGICT